MKLIHVFLVIFTVLSFSSGCSEKKAEIKTGPEGSWWTGGADGGVFIKIEDDEITTDNIYQGKIFYEHDLSIWYEGKFLYNKNSPFDYKNQSLYDGWDGEKLYLKDNSYLSATNPPD